MNWLETLFFGNTIAHAILILSLVVTIGVLLGRIKFGGVSLGVTWVLFVGIVFGHYKMGIDDTIIQFVKEFGLILFVFSVGLQVGPGFFSSFKKGGVSLNVLATIIVFLSCAFAYIIHLLSGTSMVTMVGVLFGAVTNTPGLGAAQQTYADTIGSINPALAGTVDDSIAMGYAVAYPLGVVGITLSIVFIKFLFGMKIERENEHARAEEADNAKSAVKISVEVRNEALVGKTIETMHELLDKDYVVSRLCRADGKIEIPTGRTEVKGGDKLLIITDEQNRESVTAFIGEALDMDSQAWKKLDEQLVSRKIVITREHVSGKTLEQLRVRSVFGVNVTRVTRAGVDLVAAGDLALQFGDRVIVVGSEENIDSLARVLGNSVKDLRHPNLMGIFLGIAVGVIFGSIPFTIPGMPQAIKLGLAGGPLIIAILISSFGYKFKVVTYTTQSANMMLREIGISLFLAAVGLSAGEGFIDTIVNGGGYLWVMYGVVITVLPLIIGAAIGRFGYKLNYYTLMGVMAGSCTNPSALAYSNSVSPNNRQAISYATVYPLSMFLRVLTAQIMMLIAL
ncbi:MAG: putative transporter [Bacteroidales bacterium]|nr:putative transporter [Bacteroidales bacterium]